MFNHFASGMKPAWHHCFETGQALLEQKEYKRAIQAFADALDCCTDASYRPSICHARGLASLHAGKYNDAIADLTIAIRANPGYASAYELRGVCFAQLDHHERAVQDFDRAIESGKVDALVYAHRGNSYLQLGMLEFALTDLVEATRLDAEKAVGLDRLAKRVSHAAMLAPSPVTCANRALVLHFTGGSQAAGEELNRAWAAASSCADLSLVFTRFAQIKLAQGNLLGAVQDCSRAVQQDPQNALAFYVAAISYQHLGYVEEAKVTFQHCREVVCRQVGAAAREIARLCQREIEALKPAAQPAWIAVA